MQARRIGEASLGERLPHPGSPDELGRLIDTLNGMLARIERSVEAQRRFTADASHELRSPLSRLRAELEVTLRRPRDSSEYQEALRSCLEEVERLSRLTEELLTLAHLDAERPLPERDAGPAAPDRRGGDPPTAWRSRALRRPAPRRGAGAGPEREGLPGGRPAWP